MLNSFAKLQKNNHTSKFLLNFQQKILKNVTFMLFYCNVSAQNIYFFIDSAWQRYNAPMRRANRGFPH